jgi:O-antigen/teichoic acid export membrane protein
LKALRKLSGETAIYGMPSIVGRFLNWWLVPYWTHVLHKQSELGQISNIYAYVAFLLVILTFGMETGYFRFATKEKNNTKVFSTALFTLSSTSLLFIILLFSFLQPVTSVLELEGYAMLVSIVAITLVLDVISTLPFAALRLANRPLRFASIKFINIGVNIALNLFFLTLCPYLLEKFPGGFISSFYDPAFGIGYVFVANLSASVITFLLLIPYMKVKFVFDYPLFKKMVTYSFPILIIGITGMINQNIDKILLPKLLPESDEPMKQLGIYAASFKMAVVLNMFIQAFRYAFEPFFFSRKGDESDKHMYVIIMKYFAIIGLIIFLGLSTFIDIFKLLINSDYHEGLGVIPIVLLANLFMGIYFNLSLWYKITDHTRYGAYIGIAGSFITILINILLIPIMGYYASALAILLCFITISIVSYFWGMKYFPVKYKVKNFLFYLFVALLLFAIYWIVRSEDNSYLWLALLINMAFIATVFFKEKKELKSLLTK